MVVAALPQSVHHCVGFSGPLLGGLSCGVSRTHSDERAPWMAHSRAEAQGISDVVVVVRKKGRSRDDLG